MEKVPARAATILLVEDDEFVRNVAVEILERAGFAMVRARDATEAASLFAQSEGNIDLLLTDVVMPGKTGPELAAELQVKQPELKVVLMSGYGDSCPEARIPESDDVFYLAKPFSVKTLVDKINEVFGRSWDGSRLALGQATSNR